MTKNSPSNLTWELWELIPELFPEAKRGGRPRRTTCMYPVVNAILYLLCQGCTWRALPGEPPWSTVYGYLFQKMGQRPYLTSGS
ncbi:Mobile element protein [Richelia intracellularis]|nr:Mobile element protein [Richelia intracellularis]